MLNWVLPPPAAAGTAGLEPLGLAPQLAAILVRRGLRDAAAASAFLAPRLRALADPFLLPGMGAAVERLLAAIDGRRRIVLYGDYDVDGITAVAIMARVLAALGGAPIPFLPARLTEGYGIGPAALERCLAAHQPDLLVALDCGTSAARELAGLRRRGIEAVVFDHHELKPERPPCPLVNPRLGGDGAYLCTAGIAFKAAHALLKLRPAPGFDLRACLDLAALGTVADVVPLIGENRILVAKGLAQLAATRWPGLAALAAAAGLEPPFTATDLGFRLGPRLNAAGRLGSAGEALELLLTADPGRARALAASLDHRNRERQALEQQTLDEATAELAANFDPARDAAIVLGRDGWHPGVLGIVAARLTRTYHRPTILVGFAADGTGKGSGRSIHGLSLVEALAACAAHLDKFGGHEMAAGLAVRRASFPAFRDAFAATAAARLTPADLAPRLELDAELPLAALDFDFLDQHDRLQPFGSGNPQPLFVARGVGPAAPPHTLKEKHLRLLLAQNGSRLPAIFFGGTAAPLPEAPWDIAFRISRNSFRGRVELQVQIAAIRAAHHP